MKFKFALFDSGKIVFYTHPPEEHRLPTHLSADIVSEWSKEFDLVSLQLLNPKLSNDLLQIKIILSQCTVVHINIVYTQ